MSSSTPTSSFIHPWIARLSPSEQWQVGRIHQMLNLAFQAAVDAGEIVYNNILAVEAARLVLIKEKIFAMGEVARITLTKWEKPDEDDEDAWERVFIARLSFHPTFGEASWLGANNSLGSHETIVSTYNLFNPDKPLLGYSYLNTHKQYDEILAEAKERGKFDQIVEQLNSLLQMDELDCHTAPVMSTPKRRSL